MQFRVHVSLDFLLQKPDSLSISLIAKILELKYMWLSDWKENRVLYDTVAHGLIVFQGHMTNHDAQTAL